MESLVSDARYALRQLVQRPGFTIAVSLTLALGIGATTSVFSVADAVLLQPPPYRDPGALVAVWTHPNGAPQDRDPTSLPDLDDWRAQNTAFSGVAAVAFERFDLTGPEGTDQARGAQGTGDLFAVLGTPAFLGRTLGPADEHQAVVVLSYRLWLRRYGGDRSVIGKTVNLYDDPYTIVGVMPPAFHFPTPDIDLWTGLNPIYASVPDGVVNPWISSRSMRGYRAVARLKPGTSLGAAEAGMNALERRLAQSYPEADAGTDLSLQPLGAFTVGGVQRPVWLLLGAAGFVLLIACANVAHLLLSRTTGRAREIAVRQALGAGRARVVRQLLTESLVLGLVGGAAGVALAEFGTAALAPLIPADLPGRELIGVNTSVLLFAGVVALASGLGFGLAPAWQVWRGRFSVSLSGGARGVGAQAHGTRARRALMAAEVAVALVLLCGAGLMLRTLSRLANADPGFAADHLLTFHVSAPRRIYTDPPRLRAFVAALLRELRAIPGARQVGASSSLPPSFLQEISGFSIEGRPVAEPGHEPEAVFIPSTPGYLDALGAPLVAGRDFADADGADAPPVALVNRTLARRFFENGAAVGKRINIDGLTRTIVGVTGDVVFQGIDQPTGPVVLVPFAQSPFAGVWVAVRTAGDPAFLGGAVRGALQRVEAGVYPRNLFTMEQVLHDSLSRQRFQSLLLALFGFAALCLAAVGTYGVIAYGVAERKGEMGIRLALGASPSSVLALVVRQGLVPVGVGLVVGVGAALLLTRLMRSLLYGISATDVPTFAGVTVVLAVTALVAAYIPARRAAGVDPIVALRTE